MKVSQFTPCMAGVEGLGLAGLFNPVFVYPPPEPRKVRLGHRSDLANQNGPMRGGNLNTGPEQTSELERPMPDYPLPQHLQVVRNSLSYADLRLLAQEVLDKITPLVYAEGLADGKEKILHTQRDARERRKLTRGRKIWITAVYFIQSPQAIKIGMSNNPERRLKVLQTSHPEPLRLIAYCEGGQELEREYHARFAAHRLHGEWFSPHPDILAEIDRLKAAPAVPGIGRQ